jgi:hypothetical protein
MDYDELTEIRENGLLKHSNIIPDNGFDTYVEEYRYKGLKYVVSVSLIEEDKL